MQSEVELSPMQKDQQMQVQPPILSRMTCAALSPLELRARIRSDHVTNRALSHTAHFQPLTAVPGGELASASSSNTSPSLESLEAEFELIMAV